MAAADTTPVPIDSDVDPRRARSRARLVEAAASLLSSGGVEAVTANAVSRVSRVARTTLYRHFETTSDLVVAAFDRIMPDGVDFTEPTGTLRDQLVQLVHRNAEIIDEAPIHLTVLSWIAISTNAPEHTTEREKRLAELRIRVMRQYRESFDRFLDSDLARRELGDVDHDLVIIQLFGPIVFSRLSGLRVLSAAEREQIVDDFLAARTRP